VSLSKGKKQEKPASTRRASRRTENGRRKKRLGLQKRRRIARNTTCSGRKKHERTASPAAKRCDGELIDRVGGRDEPDEVST